MKKTRYLFFLLLCLSFGLDAQNDTHTQITQAAETIESKVIEWRRYFHQYPELSNREFKTSEKIAEILRSYGLAVETGIAHTGVVGVLDTGKPGPMIGLRADIDGLPVVERVDIPFASKEKTTYLDKDVGIMHACGHDTHIAMLLGAVDILVGMKDQLKGKLVFIFQPAEEGAPPGEEGGAKLMIKEGLLDKYKMEAIFGQHINSGLDVGKVTYKFGGTMAAADRLVIKVKGKQTHGSRPWGGVDPVTVSAQIIMGLQTIISRQTELTKEAAVISIGKISGGVRNNIIPEEVEMIGTIRTLDQDMQRIIHEKIRKTATLIAESAGAKAEVDIIIGYPVTYNSPELSRKMLPSLFGVVGEDQVSVVAARTGAEDFSFFANEIPGFYFFTGGKPLATEKGEAAPHHTPDFFIDESGLVTGVKAMTAVAVDYLMQ